MNTEELCRVTIVGPQRQVDLAVPGALPIGGLLPTLLAYVVPAAGEREPSDGWVLQRLGEEPMPPGDTPDQLNWREGERFYLRRAGDGPAPMVFDDVAAGVAASVSQGGGRWRPEYNRPLFLAVLAVVLVLLGRLLLDPGAEGVAPFAAAALAVLFTGLAISLDRTPPGSPAGGRDQLAAAATVAAGAAAAIAGGTAAAGSGGAGLSGLEAGPVLAAAGGLAVAGAVITLAQRFTRGPAPAFPAVTGLIVGLVVALAAAADLTWTVTAAPVAGAVLAIGVAALVHAPRFALRVAGLRVPQLPRNAGEMHFDVSPMGAGEMGERSRLADQLLVASTLSAALLVAGAIGPLLGEGDGYAFALGIVGILVLLVRAGGVGSVPQRLGLAVCGLWGLVTLVLWLPSRLTTPGLVLLIVAVALLLLPLGAAAVRPPGRRMIPLWGYLNQWLELLTAVAVVPLLGELFGLYSWAHGLTG